MQTLAAWLAGAAAPPSAGAFVGWVQALSENHPFFYALVTVTVLLVAGAVTGVVMEMLLEAVGLETEELDHEE
jgi:hypothetical protein